MDPIPLPLPADLYSHLLLVLLVVALLLLLLLLLLLAPAVAALLLSSRAAVSLGRRASGQAMLVLLILPFLSSVTRNWFSESNPSCLQFLQLIASRLVYTRLADEAGRLCEELEAA